LKRFSGNTFTALFLAVAEGLPFKSSATAPRLLPLRSETSLAPLRGLLGRPFLPRSSISNSDSANLKIQGLVSIKTRGTVRIASIADSRNNLTSHPLYLRWGKDNTQCVVWTSAIIF